MTNQELASPPTSASTRENEMKTYHAYNEETGVTKNLGTGEPVPQGFRKLDNIEQIISELHDDATFHQAADPERSELVTRAATALEGLHQRKHGKET